MNLFKIALAVASLFLYSCGYDKNEDEFLNTFNEYKDVDISKKVAEASFVRKDDGTCLKTTKHIKAI